MLFGKQSLQGCESNWRNADGVRVENIPRNHNVGPPREDSKSDERPTVWTWALQRQDHLHVTCTTTLHGEKKGNRKMRLQFTDSCELCSQILSRSLVFLGAWIRRKNCTELTLTNQMDHGIEWRKKWWQISLDPVIHCFVPPVLLREENYEAKEEARSQCTSMVVMKNTELLPRTVISANQLSINGADGRFMQRSTQRC